MQRSVCVFTHAGVFVAVFVLDWLVSAQAEYHPFWLQNSCLCNLCSILSGIYIKIKKLNFNILKSCM